jgi:preprotein translocase subunit SecD
MLAWRRHHPFAVLGVVALIAPMLAACQAQPGPRPSNELPSRVVTVPVRPNLGQGVIDLARDILVRRLELLGAADVSVETTATEMTFTMRLPNSIPQATANQALRTVGRLAAVPPFAGTTLAEGDAVPDWFPAIWDSGGGVRSARVTMQDGRPEVEILLTADGQKAMSDYTSRHVGEPLPMALDGKVLTTPIIQAPITGGSLLITLPDDSTINPTLLAAMFSSGPLPDGWIAGP